MVTNFLLFLGIAILASLSHASNRETVNFSGIKDKTYYLGKHNSFGYFNGYVSDCYFIGSRLDIDDFPEGFKNIYSALNDVDKVFFITTSLYGAELLARYNLAGEKSFCFNFINAGKIKLPLIIIKAPNEELKKISERDFGYKDARVMSYKKARPYGKPPYPLINVFLNASIYEFGDEKEGFTQLIYSEKLTAQYHDFLTRSFQFPRSSTTYMESSVEDVYRKYLSMNTEIYNCIDDNDIKCVEAYHKMGFDLNATHEKFEPLLMFSIRKERSEVIEKLLELGVNPNIKSKDGYTPLMLTASEGELTTSKILVKYGANPNIKTPKGVLALDISKEAKNNQVSNYLSSITTAEGVYDKKISAASNQSTCASLIGNLFAYNACMGDVSALRGFGSKGLKALYATQKQCNYLAGVDSSGMSYLCDNPNIGGCSALDYSNDVRNACGSCGGSNLWLRVFAAGEVIRCY